MNEEAIARTSPKLKGRILILILLAIAALTYLVVSVYAIYQDAVWFQTFRTSPEQSARGLSRLAYDGALFLEVFSYAMEGFCLFLFLFYTISRYKRYRAKRLLVLAFSVLLFSVTIFLAVSQVYFGIILYQRSVPDVLRSFASDTLRYLLSFIPFYLLSLLMVGYGAKKRWLKALLLALPTLVIAAIYAANFSSIFRVWRDTPEFGRKIYYISYIAFTLSFFVAMLILVIVNKTPYPVRFATKKPQRAQECLKEQFDYGLMTEEDYINKRAEFFGEKGSNDESPAKEATVEPLDTTGEPVPDPVDTTEQ